jgi:hypothetical protein
MSSAMMLGHSVDIEQHNLIRQQQLDAVRLIQISLEKLTQQPTASSSSNNHAAAAAAAAAASSSTSSNANQTGESSKTGTGAAAASPQPSLVYKEMNLHRNLLVSKILNKAKCAYYQSVVQNMRLSLMAKLNYYSNLIQQFNATNGCVSEEMRVLMQQILQETYQFNLANPNDQISTESSAASQMLSLLQQSQPSHTNSLNNKRPIIDDNQSDNQKINANAENRQSPLKKSLQAQATSRTTASTLIYYDSDASSLPSQKKRVKKSQAGSALADDTNRRMNQLQRTKPNALSISSTSSTATSNLSSSSSSSSSATVVGVDAARGPSGAAKNVRPFFRIKKKQTQTVTSSSVSSAGTGGICDKSVVQGGEKIRNNIIEVTL